MKRHEKHYNPLLTGDKALRKAADLERVQILGTLGIIDQLWDENRICESVYRKCLMDWLDQTSYGRRLPIEEIQKRVRRLG